MQEGHTENSKETFQSYLEREYLQRKALNPSYSLRAFALLIGVDQSILSKFLRGKSHFTWNTVEQCLSRLSAPPEVVSYFREEKHNLTSEFNELEETIVTAMASWKHWAILEYLKIDSSSSDEAIADRFHIGTSEVKEILAALCLLGFIKKQNEKYILLKPNNSWVANYRTTEARKELQKSLALISAKSIDEIPVESRHHGSLTVAIDKSRLPEIKEKMNSILAEMGQHLQKKSELNEVYQLTLSFFPLTRLEQQ